MENQVINDAKLKFKQSLDRFNEELKKLRTGRAHPSMLDGVVVEAYGTPMPIVQVATVTTPEAQLLQVSPFDPNNLQAIIQAIRDDQSLGLNPVDDGRVVRIQMPAMTEERRKQVVKQLHDKAEECMISLRQVRHEAREKIEASEKAKDIGKDAMERTYKQIDEQMNLQKTEVDKLLKAKESEILTI